VLAARRELSGKRRAAKKEQKSAEVLTKNSKEHRSPAAGRSEPQGSDEHEGYVRSDYGFALRERKQGETQHHANGELRDVTSKQVLDSCPSSKS